MRLFIIGLMAVWMTGTAFAQNQRQAPESGSTPSGFDIVSEWKCTGGMLTVQFDNGPTYRASYGAIRNDTQGLCDDTNKGGVFLWNWHQLGDGSSALKIFDDASGLA